MSSSFPGLWAKLAPPDLPQPVAHVQFNSNRNWHFDYAFPELRCMVAVEFGDSADRDREKFNQAAALGWRVLHFENNELERNAQRCIDLVIKALKLL